MLSINEKYSASDQRLCQRPPPIRKLFSQIREHCDDNSENDDETLQVYLRIKPSPHYKNTIKIVNGSKLTCKPPITSKMCKTAEKSEFIFSKIFDPDTTQKVIFEDTVLPSVVDLIGARNCLLFSYGTTNAGKTYTIQGDNENPGVIPRALHVLFSKITINKNIKHAPHMATSVRRINVDESTRNCVQKEDFLKLYISTRANKISQYQELNNNYGEISSSSNDYSNQYANLPTCSVWVSFLELYNEQIYDLLDPYIDPPRKQLKLSADKHHNYYVKGLKQFFVRNAEEAYRIYQCGSKNLKVASTKVNENSSRSHCIFVIRLINESDPEFVTISSLSICDLAGIERQTKTQNRGIRLKEAGNINLSLFTLNRCFKTLRKNQSKTSASLVIPYRSSKLTRLISTALLDTNNVRIIMIVNINPSEELFDETQQVLKICAIASEIKSKPLENIEILQRRTRFSSIICERDNIAFDYQPFEIDFQKNKIFEYVEKTEKILLEVKEKEKVIKQIHEHYQQMLKDSSKFHEDEVELMKKEFTESIQRRIKFLKTHYESKISSAENHKKLEEIKHEELQKQNEKLRRLVDNNRNSFELAEIKQKLSEINEILKKKDSTIENLYRKCLQIKEQNQVIILNIDYLEKCEEELQKDIESKEQEIQHLTNRITYLKAGTHLVGCVPKLTF